MKRFFGLILLSVFPLVSCVKEDETTKEKGNQDLVITNPDQGGAGMDGDDESIDAKFFSVINLNYPGLEKAKAEYEAENLYGAAAKVLEYFRHRTNVIHPDVSLVAPVIAKGDQRIADQALENRLYVKNYRESASDDGDVYYDLTDKDGINWMFEPEGADQEYQYQLNRLQFALPLAKAFAVSKDEKYAEKYVFLYNDWLDTFPHPKEGETISRTVNYQWYGLQPTERSLNFLQILFYILPSENLTPEVFSKFMVAYDTTVESVLAHPEGEITGNIRLSQSQAVAMAGMIMPEFTNADKWMQQGAELMSEQTDLQFLSDGIHNEFDISYHMGAISDFMSVYNTAKVNNCLDRYPSDYTAKLHSACNFFADIIYPDYTVDNFNDTRSANMTKNVIIRNLKNYSSMFPEDEELKWMATEGFYGTEPAKTSVLYNEGGYYVLRNGRKKESTMLILKNNSNADNKWHCQPDNGTIGLYKNGRSFLPDAGVSSYGGTSSTNALRRDYAASIMHNTVTRNKIDFDSNHRNGKFLKAETMPTYEYIVVENESYSDLTHRRAVFMVENSFYVIVDEAYGAADNVPVVINFSLCADTAKNGLAENAVEIDDLSTDYVYGAHTVFADGNNMAFRTFVDTKGGYDTYTGTCYYTNNILTGDDKGIRRKRYQVILNKTADIAARYITVIMPVDKTVPEINAVFTDNAAGSEGVFHNDGTSVRVTVDGKVYNLSYKL